MPIVFQDWLNANEQRAYPINDSATRQSDGGVLLPHDILVDAHIWLPASAGRGVFLSSVGLSPRLVSLTFAATNASLCGGSPSPEPFVPVAVLTLARPVTRFKNYKLEALYPGAGGWVAFGAAVEQDQTLNLLFNTPEATLLLDRAVRAYNDIPVLSLGKLDVSVALSGLVHLRGRSGQLRTFKTRRLIDGVERDVAAIAMDLSSSRIDRLKAFAGLCGHRPQNGDCNKTPITQINDVRPNENGNINIEFKGAVISGGGDHALVADFPLGLSGACLTVSKLLTETCPDIPEPEGSSSSSIASEVDDSAGDGSSSSSGSSTESEPEYSGNIYCENFNTGFGEMGVVIPPLAWNAGRIEVPSGVLGEQLALNNSRPQTIEFVGDMVTLSTIIRPDDPQQGEGHIVFSYKNSGNFFFAGLTLRPSTSVGFPYPNGSFFVGKRVSSTLAWPAALGLGYNFLAGARFHPPVKLAPTDYKVNLVISKIASNSIQIQMLIDYIIDGTPYTFDSGSSVIVPQTVSGKAFFNVRGKTGFGAVFSPRTKFDKFGINCPVF